MRRAILPVLLHQVQKTVHDRVLEHNPASAWMCENSETVS